MDFEAASVRLNPGRTKNQEGRTIFLTPELLNLLAHQWSMTIVLERQQRKIVPWVFHRQGIPIKNFRKAWRCACEKAGEPGQLFHDL
jgi:integrase